MAISNLRDTQKGLVMEIAKRDKIEAISGERSTRIQEEIIGRLMMMLFILSLIVFSYFSLV